MTLIRPPDEPPPSGEEPPERLLSAEQAYALTRSAEEVYNAFVRNNWRHFCAFACASIGSADDAEDIAQEAVIGGWENDVSARFNGNERRMFTYVLSAIDNLTHNMWRESGRQAAAIARRVASILPGAGAPETPLEYTILNEFYWLFDRALRGLPRVCRQVFVMVRVNGTSYAEAAEVLKISETTVDPHLRRAIRLLEKKLGPDYKGVFKRRGREDTP